MMIRLEGVTYQASILELVGFAFLEGNTESLDWIADHSAHHRGNGRRIDAARQEHSEWYVSHETQTNRMAKEFMPLFYVIRIALLIFLNLLEANIPIASDEQLAVAPN